MKEEKEKEKSEQKKLKDFAEYQRLKNQFKDIDDIGHGPGDRG